MAFRIYKSFDKKHIKLFVTKILIGVSILFIISLITATGSGAFNISAYSSSGGVVSTVSTSIGVIGLSSLILSLSGIGGANFANLETMSIVLLITYFIVAIFAILALIYLFKKFIDADAFNPLTIGIIMLSLGLIYLIVDIVFVSQYISVYGSSDAEGVVYFAGDGVISIFALSLFIFGLSLASCILLHCESNGCSPTDKKEPLEHIEAEVIETPTVETHEEQKVSQ